MCPHTTMYLVTYYSHTTNICVYGPTCPHTVHIYTIFFFAYRAYTTIHLFICVLILCMCVCYVLILLILLICVFIF